MSKVNKVTDSNVEEFIQSPITILQFSAEWCGPCRMLGPIIDELAIANTDVAIGKVNVDESPELASKYGIRGVPTVIFFKDGEIVEKVVGVKSKNEFQGKIDGLKS